jgi:protein SCO1/2
VASSTGELGRTGARGGRTFGAFVVLAVVLVALIVVRALADAGGGGTGQGSVATSSATPSGASPSASVDPARYLIAPTPAPDLTLSGPDGVVSLAAMRGRPVLVFFGYTHCPDVCPATIGSVGVAIDAADVGAQAILATIDPERDTVEWLAEFVRFLPDGFTAGTGTPETIAATASAWGVRYARVDTDDPAGYSMSHTADVFLIDAAGMLRARFPFGTPPEAMTALLLEVGAGAGGESPGPAASPTAARTDSPPSEGPPDSLEVQVVSSSVWAGGASPVILALRAGAAPIGGLEDVVDVRLLAPDGAPVGPTVRATPVRPPGLDEVSFVAILDIPSPGAWRLEVITAGPTTGRGLGDLVALDPGGTAPLGRPAPDVATLTAAEVSSLTWLTTDPLPDPRLTAVSTLDALAARAPWVLVVDSAAFKVTPACGKALVLAKRLLDRWTDVPFIHHEPYVYDVITTEPVLRGTLEKPILTDVATSWGIGAEPWGAASMPWTFIIDGDGVVRAKYQGILGSADVDVMLALLAGGS